jgi:hypothetical protein
MALLSFRRVTLGGVAQLAERFVRNEEVVGSIPFTSTRDGNEEGKVSFLSSFVFVAN